jgi:hypothetical integral membrane protein (TIGR02206 family)
MIYEIIDIFLSLPRIHIIATTSTLAIVAILLITKKILGTYFNIALYRKIAFTPLIIELIFQLSVLNDNNWFLKESLPLEFSYLTSLSIILYYFISDLKIKSWLYFAGIWSAAVAFFNTIIIGDETWYTLLRYYGHHGLLLFYGLESVLGGFRPTLTNYINAIKMTSYIIITISIFNILAGSNYMFTRTKPDGMNFTILMPEWPGYFIIILALGLTFYSILYFCGKKQFRTL